MMIRQWITTLQPGFSICGITPYLAELGYPVHFNQQVLSDCYIKVSEGFSVKPQASPTPLVMVSGKIANTEMQIQPQTVYLFYANPKMEWLPILEDKFDLAWLQTLTPSFASGWMR